MIGGAILGVVLALAGGVLMVGGSRRQERPPSRRVLPDGAATLRGTVSFGTGMAAVLLTRWPVAAVGGAAFGWWLVGRRQHRPAADHAARTEAIAGWCELLRDAAGTSRGIEGILVATASSAPQPIAPSVTNLVRRLETEPLDDALHGLADDLAHPLGDLLTTALRLASSAGSRRVRLVLDDLAHVAHLEATMYRRLDVARARPRATMRLVAMIVGGFVLALALLARGYLAPYRSPLGQLVLVVVTGYWALGFWWMHRMGRAAPVERFLTRVGPT